MQTPDHIVVVVEENHDADQVIGNANAPYINNVLVNDGLYYSNAHGTDHPSQPNYLEMFAGANPGNQGVNSPLQQDYPAGTENTPAGASALANGDNYNTGQPFSIPNLGAELLAAGDSFAGYSEDQPSVGFTGAQADSTSGTRAYVEKHNPWAQFQGTGTNQLPASTNQPFTTFQSTTDFSNLPTVSFVVPNQYNDMHNTVSSTGLPAVGKDAQGNPIDKNGNPVNDNTTIQNGDTWLQNNLEAYRQWAATHNSLLITVWDENDYDFTDANNIPMIVDGAPNLVQQGVDNAYVNHFDLLKTLESDYGLGLTGAAATAQGLPTSSSGQLLASSGLFGTITHDATSPGGQIYTIYDGLLSRAPDLLGLENWTAALQSGAVSSHTIIHDFLSSPEFTKDFGSYTKISNHAFVEDLYQTALHRPGDTQGQTSWENALANGMSRDDVAYDFVFSSEHANDLASAFTKGVFVPNATDDTIARLYYATLDRAPDTAGLQSWENAAANGLSLQTIAQDFVSSAEYQAIHGTQTNQQFVDALYQGALGRGPDTAGEQGWVNALNPATPSGSGGGLSRGMVALDFAQSAEAQQHLLPQVEVGWQLAGTNTAPFAA